MDSVAERKTAITRSFKNQTKWVWRTAIEEVYSFDDTIEFSVIRPDSGTNTGGIAYIWDENGSLITSTKVPGNKRATATIQSDKLDLERKIYTLGYGPDQIDKGVNAVAATVSIVQGIDGNREPSICYGYNNSATHVSSRYQFPKNLLSINECQIYIVEGPELKDSSYALEKNIHIFSENDSYKGIQTLKYTNGTFQRGHQYTVCLNVYSWKRQIAGYSFIY